MRASAGALAVHTALILAGCHVRASAGDLAVHGALIPCVCVCACLRVCPVTNSFLITPRIGTKFVSVDRKAPGRWTTATGFFLCSAWAEQRPSKPTTPPKNVRFSVSFRQYSESTLRTMQKTREAKNRSFNVQTVKQEASDGSHHGLLSRLVLARSCIVVTGHDQSMHCPLFSRPSQM